jgi:pimeloyl-ACP methyl ester carboxylesterase
MFNTSNHRRAALHRLVLILPLLLAAGGIFLSAQEAWRDPSTHDVRFVTLDQDVRLEVLDWGGSGPAIVLLTGSGHTAHVYDDFAPKLTDCCHVYGITRRGYGASSTPATGYDDRRLAEDVFQVIEQVKIPSPVLVGHSMAGGEMTTLGRQHSDRISGLVYLDALGDLEDEPPADPEWAALAQKVPPDLRPTPVCPPQADRTFAAFRVSQACRLGFVLPIPESELRNQFNADGDRVGSLKSPDWVSRAIGQGQVFRRDYSNIRVPVLALLEAPVLRSDFTPKDDDERKAIDAFLARGRVLMNRRVDKVKLHVANVHIVYLPGAGHYVFLTRESDVLREIHTFVGSLTR